MTLRAIWLVSEELRVNFGLSKTLLFDIRLSCFVLTLQGRKLLRLPISPVKKVGCLLCQRNFMGMDFFCNQWYRGTEKGKKNMYMFTCAKSLHNTVQYSFFFVAQKIMQSFINK